MRRLPSILVLAVAGITAAVLPVVEVAAAAPTITNVTPASHEIDTEFQPFTFTTTATYSNSVKPTVTLTRTATASSSSPETISGQEVSVSGNQVFARFDTDLHNPGAYDAEISGPTTSPPSPSTTNSCTSCVTLTSNPTVTSVSPANTGADFSYPGFNIYGTDFTMGPYTQCTSLPCSTTTPNVAVYNGAALDPYVTLDKSDKNSGTKNLEMPMTIGAADPGGYRTIKLTNTDGNVGTCTNCLHIAPAMTLTSVTPPNLPPGSSGRSILIKGTNFASDTQVQFLRNGTGPTTDVTWTHEQVSTDGTQILLTGVATDPSTPDGSSEDIGLTSPGNHVRHQFPNAFQVGGNPPSGAGESAPTNVTASPGDQQAFVQWTPPASASDDPITGYVVHTLPSGPDVPAPASASSATVGPLTNGTTYTFTVTVTYKSTASYTSQPSNAVTPSAKPDAPTNVNASAGDRKAFVSWTAPASATTSPVDSYTVTADPGGQHAVTFSQNGQPPPTTAVVSGLKNGTSYTFTVTAHNGSGTSNSSAPSNAVTPKGDPALTLLGPAAIDKGKSAHLHGQLVDSNGKAVAGATVKLSQRHSGAHQYGPLKTLTTSKKGRWSFDVKPVTTTRYKIRWNGNTGNNKVSTAHTVKVRETGTITSPKTGDSRNAGTVTVLGHASSAKGFPVALQQRRNGKWVTITSGKVGSHHKVKLSAAFAPGTAVIRLKVSGELGTVTGYSPRVRFTVS